MNRANQFPNLNVYLRRRPDAYANINGSQLYPKINGNVRFFGTPYGVIVVSMIEGLPMLEGSHGSPIFAYHIHSGESCTGSIDDPFSSVRMHYNPTNRPHPYHSGDLPPLFGAGGYAFSAVLTDRFTVDEIIGKTIIIHSAPDDFTTQPSGNSGAKLACGEIFGRKR